MIHPDILRLIEEAKQKGFTSINSDLIYFLLSINATSTQTTFVLNQGFSIGLVEADRIMIEYFSLFEGNDIDDPIYETFLYGNYNPEDPNFKVTEDGVQFSL